MCNYCDEWDRSPFKRLASYGKNACPDCNKKGTSKTSTSTTQEVTEDGISDASYQSPGVVKDVVKKGLGYIRQLDDANDLFRLGRAASDVKFSDFLTLNQNESPEIVKAKNKILEPAVDYGLGGIVSIVGGPVAGGVYAAGSLAKDGYDYLKENKLKQGTDKTKSIRKQVRDRNRKNQ